MLVRFGLGRTCLRSCFDRAYVELLEWVFVYPHPGGVPASAALPIAAR